jgi:hypothetical protein
MLTWKGSRSLVEVFSNWRCNRRTCSHRTGLHPSSRPPPTLQRSANMHPNNRPPPTLKNHMAKGQTSLSLRQTTCNLFLPHHRRKLWSHTQIQTTSTTTRSMSFWLMILRARVDAILQTLYRYPRMPTSLSLHLPHSHRP